MYTVFSTTASATVTRCPGIRLGLVIHSCQRLVTTPDYHNDVLGSTAGDTGWSTSCTRDTCA